MMAKQADAHFCKWSQAFNRQKPATGTRHTCLLATTAMAAMLHAGVCTAESYMVELNAGSGFSDRDMRTQVTGYNASATLYLQPVQTVASIIAESAFLNKASSVSASYASSETDFGLTNTDEDSDDIAVSARYILGEKTILEASLSDGEMLPAGASKSVDAESYGIGIGRYIDDLTSIVLSLKQTDVDGEKDKRDSVMLRLKSIVDPSETDRAVGTVALGITQNAIANTIVNLNAGLDYYFGPRFSLGANIGLLFPNNGNDENVYGLRSQYFITDRIAVGASYAHTIFQEEDDSPSVDPSDTFTLSVTGRI